MTRMSRRTTCALCSALALGSGAIAVAQDIPVEKKVSGSFGADVSTHFISYGFDVWGDGGSWSRPSVFVWGEISYDLDPITLTAGFWSDNNNKEGATDPIGGPIQEIDVYLGASFDVDRFTFGVTFQEWYYDDTVETRFDLGVSFDDTDLIFEGFAFNPSVLWANRLYGTGLDRGAVLLFGIEPSFTLIDSETYPVTLSIPASVALNMWSIRGDDEYYDNETAGDYAFSSIGATLSVPLSFIPAEYGDWTAAGNVTLFLTDPAQIGNPRDNFLTGMLSISTSF